MLTTLVFRDHKLAAHNPPVETLAALRAEPGAMLWVDLDNPSEEEIKTILENLFGLHPLVIEDCTHDSPFPKLEAYDDYLYLVMHAVDYTRTDKFSTTELDLMLGKNFLLTFHKKPLRSVQATLERYARAGVGAVPVRGPDRFAHSLLDHMVEAYKPALAELRAELEAIEEDVLRQIAPDDLFPRVIALRKELAQLRRIVRPQRAVAAELAAGKPGFVRPLLVPYLRDLAEELARIEAQAGAWGDQLILSFRVYLNKASHEANEGIKILTAITALTMPPFLIGGWFGMNFKAMPGLDPHWTYPLAAVAVIASTGILWLFLKRRRWL
jgi:magnesium transporter